MAIIGRAQELELIRSHLEPGELVALTGPSGMGKTTVAREYVRTSGLDAVSVDCFGLSSRDAAAGVIACTGGVPKGSRGLEMWVLAAELLAKGGIELLLLDDVGFDFADLETLRRSWTGRLITTSHAAPEEGFVLPLTPVEVTASNFRNSEAFRLFESAGHLEDLTFTVDDDELPLVLEIAQRLDGHPLALCLAGRRAATTSVRTVVGLLAKGYTITDGERPVRHQTHWAALDFSWDSLPFDDQRRLYVMALFERPLRVEALADICGEPLNATLDGIRRLVRGGFVARGEFQRPLELFCKQARRAFPEGHPQPAADVLEAIRLTAVSTATAVPPGLTPLLDFGEEPSYWRVVVDRDFEGLSDEEAGVVLAAWLRYVAIRDTAVGASDRERIDRFLERFDHADAWLQASRSRTILDIESATRCADRSHSAARTPREKHDALIQKAFCLSQTFQLEEARRLFEDNFDLEFDTPTTAVIEAELRLFFGQKELAAAAVERLEGMPETPSLFGVSGLIHKAWLADDAELADAYYRRALEKAKAENMLGIYAHTLNTHALILATRLGRFDVALEELRESRDLCAKMGSPRGVARSYVEEATVRLHAGDFAEAERVSRVPPREDAGQFATAADLVWAAAMWQQGKLPELSAAWPAIRAFYENDPRDYYDSLWRAVDVGVTDDVESAAASHVGASPHWSPILRAVACLRSLPTRWSVADLLDAWPLVEATLALPQHDLGTRQVTLFIERRLPPAFLKAVTVETDVLFVLPDYEAYRIDGVWHDLTTQTVGARLLRSLVEAEGPLDHRQLGELLYPDEVVVEDALVNRINVQMSKLRNAGLKRYIVKKPDGFVLEVEARLAET